MAESADCLQPLSVGEGGEQGLPAATTGPISGKGGRGRAATACRSWQQAISGEGTCPPVSPLHIAYNGKCFLYQNKKVQQNFSDKICC